MNTIGILKNAVQEYAWGSHTAIPELFGMKAPSDRPQAELWMGAHPKAPSIVKCGDRWISLLELIEKNPKDILGDEVIEKFGNRLPYLFKILAVAKPLSVQVHPDLTQARHGFAKENRLKIPLSAPNRNYRDDNHKPESICAITPFWALRGFRKISDILSLMEKICPHGMKKELNNLQKQPDSLGLKIFFNALMTMDHKRQTEIIDDAIMNILKRLSEDDPVFKWMINLHSEYPTDIGVFSPVFLNLVCLEPNQAMFLPPGVLHAYLDGMGVELMANSDNVLRGGLTPKHVDVSELMGILNFKEERIKILLPQKKSHCEGVYYSPAEEFALSVISVKEGMAYTSAARRSVEIILCIDGEGFITDIGKNSALALLKGTSVIVPAAVPRYCIEGMATLYKASVPI